MRAASATHWPQEPSCPGAGASGPREGNSQGCAPREPAPLASPTWARRPPEPRQSSEAGSSSGTTKMRLYTEPPLSPGPSPVGSALLYLLESRHRHQALFTLPLTECLAFRLVAWANPRGPAVPLASSPSGRDLADAHHPSDSLLLFGRPKLRSCGGPSSSFQPVLGGSPFALSGSSARADPLVPRPWDPQAQVCPKSSAALN